MALTQKQELFCNNVVSGMSYKDAYLNAYNTNCNDRVALNEGSKLALRDDIQERIKTLSKPLQRAAQVQGLNKKQERIDFILERIEICKTKEDEQSIIRYTDMLNKIDNLYKDNEETKEKENSMESLDTETLKRLSKVI